jgi:hypothetical protein
MGTQESGAARKKESLQEPQWTNVQQNTRDKYRITHLLSLLPSTSHLLGVVLFHVFFEANRVHRSTNLKTMPDAFQDKTSQVVTGKGQ